jgi:hypothetical protein
MGFMDKAKKFAEQAQKDAKDGTLKERAKALADQAQAKIGDVQTQFNEGQQKGAGTPAPADAPAPDPAATAQAADTVAEAAQAADTVAEAATTPPAGAADVDRSHEAAPKVTGGDPLDG